MWVLFIFKKTYYLSIFPTKWRDAHKLGFHFCVCKGISPPNIVGIPKTMLTHQNYQMNPFLIILTILIICQLKIRFNLLWSGEIIMPFFFSWLFSSSNFNSLFLVFEKVQTPFWFIIMHWHYYIYVIFLYNFLFNSLIRVN